MMLAISGGKQSGKTHQLVEWYRKTEKPAVIVVHTKSEQKRLIDEYDILPQDVLVLSEVRLNLRGRRVLVGVDNIEYLLWECFGQVPDVITFTE